jgi:hypothetical protein
MSTTKQEQVLQSLSGVSRDDIDRMIRVLRYLRSGFRRSRRKATQTDPLYNLKACTVETGIRDLAEHHDKYLYGNKE